MDVIIEIFLIGFITNKIGLNTRYYFYKLIGKRKTKEYLSGKRRDSLAKVDQQFANMITGFTVFFFLIVCTIKILNLLGL